MLARMTMIVVLQTAVQEAGLERYAQIGRSCKGPSDWLDLACKQKLWPGLPASPQPAACRIPREPTCVTLIFDKRPWKFAW